jgi:hypothetical protein
MKYETYELKLQRTVTVTGTVFTKITLHLQRFVQNSHTEYHENPTDGLVAGTVMDGRTDVITKGVPLYCVNNG